MSNRWSAERMLQAIEDADGQPALPEGRDDEDWEHNALVLDDLFSDGLVRGTPLKDGAGAYSAYRNLRLTEEGQRRLRDATGGAAVVLASFAEVAAVERLLLVIREIEESGTLPDELVPVVDAERLTLEAQVRSPRPNRGAIEASLQGLRWVADAAASGVLGNAVFEVLRLLV
jgi:hypothetical protein